MPPKNKGEGVKIAQAAKELNVTSVTIRRYITEFNIETTSDENGIKVLPSAAMEELLEIRRLKEDGLTNPQVMEALEKRRTSGRTSGKEKDKDKEKETKKAVRKVVESQPVASRGRKPTRSVRKELDSEEDAEPAQEVVEAAEAVDMPLAEVDEVAAGAVDGDEGGEDGKSMHSLTCQTCSKTFEHMNPKLRDCLDCYRAKRRERRRGGDKHKNIIQHPLAQQVASKAQQAQQVVDTPASAEQPLAPVLPPVAQTPASLPSVASPPRISLFAGTAPQPQRTQVRNYRKAIEETRQITSNLKRRLERPDLTEAERRFLEQIYAYQLILHQGWKHLSEYRSGTGEQRYENQSSSSNGMPSPRNDS